MAVNLAERRSIVVQETERDFEYRSPQVKLPYDAYIYRVGLKSGP